MAKVMFDMLIHKIREGGTRARCSRHTLNHRGTHKGREAVAGKAADGGRTTIRAKLP